MLLVDPVLAAWQRLLIEHGYAARTVSKEYGGGGFAPDPLIAAIHYGVLTPLAGGLPPGLSAQSTDVRFSPR
jgi:alkylation response protein AidB-like acyl-CoA dehydrogenase